VNSKLKDDLLNCTSAAAPVDIAQTVSVKGEPGLAKDAPRLTGQEHRWNSMKLDEAQFSLHTARIMQQPFIGRCSITDMKR